jgi:SAM-dependent methyltransferase
VRLPGSELLTLLGPAVPSDHAGQTLADHYISAAAGRRSSGGWRVLDLGCGDGRSLDAFRRRDSQVEWVGLDLEDSPEVATRTRSDAEFATFDGERMPFADGRFDLVFCKQVLEHVRRPEPLLAEVARVLAAGGCFAGSTSQLEPYHSLSVGNHTPYGLVQLLAGAGLETVELRPGIDGLTLVARRLLARGGLMERWWTRESPLNRAIELGGRVARADPRTRNAAKLLLCGQFAFLARRPASTSTSPQ